MNPAAHSPPPTPTMDHSSSSSPGENGRHPNRRARPAFHATTSTNTSEIATTGK